MAKNKLWGLLLAASVSVFSFSGCEVFVDFGLKMSTFELYDSKIPGNDFNMLTLMLPGYQEDSAGFRYIVHYYDNDRCTGEYFAGDTLQYMVEGTWSLEEPDVINMDLDQFVDAQFKIIKLDKVNYVLETESNIHGLPIEPATTPLLMYNRKLH